MINLLKPKVTVEQIHAEFDSAEERLMKQAEDILANLSIPTESAIERKAKLAQELGFVNSEIVAKAKSITERNEKIQKTIELTKRQADILNELKFHYPNEKFLTVDELDRICEKYNLIHCPIKNYIKDIPEKNLLEIKNVKSLRYDHKKPASYRYTYDIYNWGSGGYDGKYYNPLEIPKQYRHEFTSDEQISYRSDIARKIVKLSGLPNNKTIHLDSHSEHTISYAGLFIAAPKSHFDTNGLTAKGKFGFFNVTVIEIKDPVVFEYCKDGFVRIITKWGTDDDQSYLDPALFNEKLN